MYNGLGLTYLYIIIIIIIIIITHAALPGRTIAVKSTHSPSIPVNRPTSNPIWLRPESKASTKPFRLYNGYPGAEASTWHSRPALSACCKAQCRSFEPAPRRSWSGCVARRARSGIKPGRVVPILLAFRTGCVRTDYSR